MEEGQHSLGESEPSKQRVPQPGWMYVDRLPQELSAKQLEELFLPFGALRIVESFTASGKDRHRYCYIEMPTVEASERAAAVLNGSELLGQRVRVLAIEGGHQRLDSAKASGVHLKNIESQQEK